MDFDVLITIADLYEKTAKSKPWAKKPKGWKQKSVKQYSKTMMSGKEHPFAFCTEKMKDHIDNPEAFCASVKDVHKGKKTWRKNKS